MKLKNIQANIALITLLLTVASPALAKQDTERMPATNNNSARTVTIPKHAIQVADNVFSLGSAIDPATSKLVEGFMIIDNRRDQAKGGSKGKPGDGGGTGETCYAFLANGARWKTSENYVIDPSNSDGLTDSFIRENIAAATDIWDNEVAFNIFGSEVAGTVDGADDIQPDAKNEILFADINSPGAVGVTIVWGIFRGQPDQRELVEWDQVYDDADYNFGDGALDSTVFDLLGVAAHEVGHAAGLGHPSDSCIEETMYRFVAPGETHQRDLNTGDSIGINALYQ